MGDNKWNSSHVFNFLTSAKLEFYATFSDNDYRYVRVIFLLLPIFIFQLINNSKKSARVLVFLCAPVLIFVFLKVKDVELLNLNIYVILLSAALASLIGVTKKVTRFRLGVYALVFGLSIFSEYIYFKNSAYTSEKLFVQQLTDEPANQLLEKYKEAGEFLKSHSSKGSKLLCDASVMYPLVVFNDKHNTVIPFKSKLYDLTIQNPLKQTDFVILMNEDH